VQYLNKTLADALFLPVVVLTMTEQSSKLLSEFAVTFSKRQTTSNRGTQNHGSPWDSRATEKTTSLILHIRGRFQDNLLCGGQMLSRLASIFALLLGVIGIAVSSNASVLLANTYISVSEFHKYCSPSNCGKAMPCEGQAVTITGKIDYPNVFSHGAYPHLRYEKFFLTDHKNTIEVMVVTSDNEAVFKKIFDLQNRDRNVIIKGTIVGHDLPTMKACHRGAGLELRNAGDILFQ
jgi:hypothetical protein